MQFKINLASRTYLNRRQFNAWSIGLGVVLAALLILNIRNIAGNAGEISNSAKRIAMIDGTTSGSVPEKEYQALLSRIKFANDVISRKTFNWTILLDKLEEHVPEGVALSLVDPNLKTGELKVGGMAKTFNNLRTLLENLEGSGFFRDVFLVSQSEFAIGKTQKGINFSITCKVALK